MGKSKTGGTRGYIRGRIANDVYSIGKDGKGKKQQVIRSLAESVANPRTSSQMFGRMIMSTAMQAVSAMKNIIDHSFDGFPTGQPNISEFIRRNYALISADAKAHPASGNKFAVNKYQEKGVFPGEYVISDGDVVPSVHAMPGSDGAALKVFTLKAAPTLQDFLDAAGIGDKDYITLTGIGEEGGFFYARLHVKAGADKTTAISSANLESFFDIETNSSVQLNVSAGEGDKVVTLDILTIDSYPTVARSAIFSISENGGYKHSKCVLSVDNAYSLQNADTALPTYPVGNENFLNGGDI